MPFGAGAAASRGLVRELVDPRPHAVGSLKDVYQKYPHIGNVLPAMGYSEEQMKDLERTIRDAACDAVVIATPADLRKKFRINQPTVRAFYDFEIDLGPLVDRFVNKKLNFS
jgi:predicted GTPase